MSDSPAVIIFDINGNPIGSVLDGVIYRLAVDSKITSGILTANQGTANIASNSWPVKISDGVDIVGISTVSGAKALKVDVIQTVGGSGSGGTSSSFGAAFPPAGTAAGFTDGSFMQGATVFDADTGAGIQYVLGVNLRKSASGGSVDFGTNTDPIRIDPTGTTTQPISGTVSISGTIGVTQSASPWVTNISQFGGNNVVTGTGASGVGIPRVTVSNDSNILVTQSGAWSVTANIGTTGGLALDTSVNGLLLTQGSTTSGEKGTLIQGAVTTSAPSYTTGQTNPLSLTTSGLLRIDGSGAVQPVSGTVTANQGSPNSVANSWPVEISDGVDTVGISTVSGSKALKVDVIQSVGGSGGTSSSFGAVFPASGTASGFSDGINMQGARVFDADSGVGTEYVIGVNLRGSSSGGSVELGTSSNPVKIDPTGITTQPVSGIVTANIGTTGGLALDSSVNGLLLTQGSTTAGEKGPLIQGAVTTVAPSYTTAQTSPLSLTTSGLLRVDGSGVTQPISGTITVNQGTTPWTDDIIDRAGRLLGIIYGSQGQQLKQTAVDFNTQVEIAVGSTLIDPRQIRALTSADVVTANAGSGTFTVGGTVTANIGTTGGLALDSTLTKLTIAQSTALGSNTQALVGGSVTTSAPTYTNGNINPLSLTTSGALRTDGSGTTQPISGTVTANQGTANTLANAWPVKVTDGTNTLPTGDVASRAIFEKITDGTNTVNVAAASTAPIATDPALVVNLSPNRPATYAASTNGAIAISNNATATTSVAYIFHTLANTKRIEIYRIEVSAGLETGANHDFTLRGNFITAENATPGGTTQTVNPLDRGDSASTITGATGVFRTGATGAPTRVTGDLISEEMYNNGSGAPQKILFDIHTTGKPIVLRASVSEGFEIRAVGGGNGNLAQGCEVTVTMYWTEV